MNDCACSCRLCSCAELRHLFTANDCEVLRCTACGFVQVKNPPDAQTIEGLYGERYGSHDKYQSSPGADRELKRRLQWLKRCGLEPGAKVLEAGCSTGDFFSEAKNEYDLYGVDIGKDAVRIAKERNPDAADRLQAAALEDLDFAEESFDGLVLWDVVEHLADPCTTLHKLSRFLKPDGILAFSTPDIGAPAARLAGKRWPFMTPPEHLCFFSHKTGKLLLDRLGFEHLCSMSRGKWTTAGFIAYKIGRIYTAGFVQTAVGLFRASLLNNLPVYAPSGDILYVGARKHSHPYEL